MLLSGMVMLPAALSNQIAYPSRVTSTQEVRNAEVKDASDRWVSEPSPATGSGGSSELHGWPQSGHDQEVLLKTQTECPRVDVSTI